MQLISWSAAKSTYKVSDADLETVPHVIEQHPSRKLRFVNSLDVWNLALQVNGGLAGHLAHLARCKAQAEKARATRQKNKLAAATGQAW